MPNPWQILNHQIIACERCPRLRRHCAQVAREKRAAYRDQDYWGQPVPNFSPPIPPTGSPSARLLLLGLAPGAHGANRTGRMFTGDRSGDFLFRALHETGFANQPTSVNRADSLELIDAAITAVAHCAPPGNQPTPREIANCAPFLLQTITALPNLRGIVCLGRIAFDAALRLYRAQGWIPPTQRPRFAHGILHQFEDPAAPFLLCTYHPSQQNTFTGRLTPEMLRAIFRQAADLLSR